MHQSTISPPSKYLPSAKHTQIIEQIIDARVPSSAQEGPSGILQKLGLPMGTVRNVMMPKDIVPRAFACDYTLVADLLKRVGSSFREHSCLSPGSRVALYSAVGKQLLLQPDPSLTFVRGEGYHPMLPQEVGLFILQVCTPHS